MSSFAEIANQLKTYLPALSRAYGIEITLRKSDLGRWYPERAHQIARRAAGIPDHIMPSTTPLSDEDLTYQP
jgi:hypothetical protein